MDSIVIKSVPKKEIRNKGIGDYKKTKDGLEILVANSLSENEQIEVASHELVESVLALRRGISFKKIDAWDRKNINKPGEPGEMKGAPYRKEHLAANKVENAVKRALKNRR